MELNEDLRNLLAQVLLDDSAMDEFERQLYSDPRFEEHLDPTTYLQLIESNFQTESGRRQVRDALRTIVNRADPETAVRLEVQRLLRRILDGRADLLAGIRQLSTIRTQGHDFVPAAFAVYDSETDSIPTPDKYHLWAHDALRTTLAEFDSYRAPILEECAELLTYLIEADGAFE